MMFDKKFELHTLARTHAVSQERWIFSNKVFTCWNYASKYSMEFHVVLNFWINFLSTFWKQAVAMAKHQAQLQPV